MLPLDFHIRSRQAAERTLLLEIDAQGSEGLLVLTKLQAEGFRDRRKMSGRYDEDQVAEHKRALCHVLLIVTSKSNSLNEGAQI